jgi:hypothetical protein
MSHRAPLTRRVWILAAALLAATGGAASVGSTQPISASIGATLTILEPVAASLPRVTEFAFERDGVVRIEATAPASTRRSALIMVRVASSAMGSVIPPQPPMRVTPTNGETRVRHLVNVERDDRTDRARPRGLRVEYLIVAAGT